jgi:Fe-S cluster assembly protein SufD
VERPIHLAFVYAGDKPAAVFTRSVALVGKGARVMLVESHEGPAALDYQINTAFDLVVADDAHVDHVKLTGEGTSALHISTLIAEVGAHARFNEFAFTTGGAVVRNQMFVRCAGKESILRLAGATLLRGKQHADTTLVVDHAIGGCESRETFKSVLDDDSRVIFQGKIVVRPDAQQTDARMASHALLLSERAEADNKPELEIFADDVQCGHGATSGDIDENLKFYLMARGIPEPEAEALLIESFVGEAVEAIEHAGLREELMGAVRDWLKVRT